MAKQAYQAPRAIAESGFERCLPLTPPVAPDCQRPRLPFPTRLPRPASSAPASTAPQNREVIEKTLRRHSKVTQKSLSLSTVELRTSNFGELAAKSPHVGGK